MAIKLGIIGCGYGRSVLVPAFRADPRCEVVSISARNKQHAEHAASELGIQKACANWRMVVEDKFIDAVAVAVPPVAQPEIVLSALMNRKAVFAEKPMSLKLEDAQEMNDCALTSNRPHMIDFNFAEISAWKQAKQILAEGKIGTVRNVAVHWHVESYTNRMQLANWKSSSANGGGTLFNFVSHCLYYLEWFLGPIDGLASHLFRPAFNQSGDTTAVMALSFQSGAAGSLSMSAASYLGSGHRVELYGEDGTLVLENSTSDYMKGFRLLYGKRPDLQLRSIATEDPDETRYADGRILPVSRLACRFLDWIETGAPARPNFSDGLRVQKLLDASLRSHRDGSWVTMPAEQRLGKGS